MSSVEPTTPRVYTTYAPRPRQSLFHRIQPLGPKLVKGAIGGLAGGKTTCCEQELVELCNRMPGGRSAAIRLHIEGEGEVSLLADLKKLLLPGGFAIWRSGESKFEFPNGHELFFMHGKDYEKFGSMEFCAVYIMEAHEVPLRVFHTLSARLRHPAGKIDGRPYYRLLFDARGVTENHWINREFIQKGWNVDDGEDARKTVANPHYVYVRFKTSDGALDSSYEESLRLEHAADPVWIRIYIDGEIGYDLEGEPVFADSFDPDVHVSTEEIPADDSLPILRGWDFGYRAPACGWYQYTRSGRLLQLRELAPSNVTTEGLVEQAVALQSEAFPRRGAGSFLDFCDRAGDGVESVSHQRDIDIVEQMLQTYCTYRYANREYGLGILRRLMLGTTKVAGQIVHRFMIDPSCTTMKAALGGGYYYPNRTQGNLSSGPIKGGPFAAIVDVARYVAQEVVEEDLMTASPTQHRMNSQDRSRFGAPSSGPEREIFFGKY